MSEELSIAVSRYNRQSKSYRVIIEEPDMSGGYEEWCNKFELEISRGDGPDIFQDSWIDVGSYAQKGGIIPLDECLAEDMDEYITSFFDCGRIDGKLYSIPENMNVKTFATSEELAAGRGVWTLSEYMEAVEASESKKALDLTASQIIYYFGLCDVNNSSFIDWENGKSNLEGEEFIKLIDFAKKYGIDAEVLSDYNDKSTSRGIKDGEVASRFSHLFSPDEMRLNEAYYDGTPVYPGFPSAAGTQSYATISGLCVNAGSDKTDAAKDFLRWFVSKDGQQAVYDYYQTLDSQFYAFNMPLRWDILDRQIEDFNERSTPGIHFRVHPDGTCDAVEYLPASDGIITVKNRPLDEEETKLFKDIVRNAKPISYEIDYVSYIIDEEIGAFLEGQKTADEVAKIIDSRVQLMLDENK